MRVRLSGITLIELLIVLTIMATLLTLSVPSFTDKLSEWRSRAQAMRLLSAINLARSRAVRLDREITLCPGESPASACSGPYSHGFAVIDGIGEIIRHYPERRHIVVWNSAGTREENRPLSWRGDGWGSRNMSWLFCPESGSVHWAVVVNRLGRPRLVQDWGTCPN